LELLAAFPDPRDEEFRILLPYFESALATRGKVGAVGDKIAARAWEVFFGSTTLFVAADRLGCLEKWLNSGEEHLENTMTFYLRRQTDAHADRVAELFTPFVGCGGPWKDRLRYLMEWRGHDCGRRFIELFLTLLDDGTLDDARDRFASNGTFWSMLYGLAEKQPEWCAEVAAHWLDRRITLAKASENTGGEAMLRFQDDFGVDDLFQSARRAPKKFLEPVLPAVLRAAEAFVYPEQDGLLLDRIWPTHFRGEHLGITDAYPNACATAFECLASTDPEALRPFVALLESSHLVTANHLLQSAYLAAPKMFSNEAMALLSSEVDRLHCGYSDSPFWIARCVIENCSKHCSDENFRRIEDAILTFASRYERSKEGFRHKGYTAYALASALSPDRRSRETNSRLAMDCDRRTI
jgi:hypothetical protein